MASLVPLLGGRARWAIKTEYYLQNIAQLNGARSWSGLSVALALLVSAVCSISDAIIYMYAC